MKANTEKVFVNLRKENDGVLIGKILNWFNQKLGVPGWYKSTVCIMCYPSFGLSGNEFELGYHSALNGSSVLDNYKEISAIEFVQRYIDPTPSVPTINQKKLYIRLSDCTTQQLNIILDWFNRGVGISNYYSIESIGLVYPNSSNYKGFLKGSHGYYNVPRDYLYVSPQEFINYYITNNNNTNGWKEETNRSLKIQGSHLKISRGATIRGERIKGTGSKIILGSVDSNYKKGFGPC